MKICKSCGKNKQLKSYYVSYQGVNGPVYAVECKECSKKRTTARHRKLPEKQYEYSIKYKYGISMEEYFKILDSQGNVCAICKKDNRFKKRFHLDHNHETNKVRGILCQTCNVGIGKFQDNIEFLEAAIKYLKFYA
jgi:hypothetical protein